MQPISPEAGRSGTRERALFFGRRGAYPRTDAVGATLIGMILSALSVAILFTRLFAIIRGG